MRDLYFSFPQAIYLFLFLPFLFLGIWALSKYRKSILKIYTAPENLSQLVYPRSKILSYIKNTAWIGVWICACLALMDPKGNVKYWFSQETETTPSPIPKRQPHDVIFLIDASASMSVPDVNGHTRLNKAKDIANEIISQLDGQSVAVDAFTSQLTSLVPSTLDYLFTRLMIQAIQINEGDVGGTHFRNIFESLKQKVFSTASSKMYTLILLSDGGDQNIENTEGTARQKAIENIVASIPNPQQFHLRLFTIGIGSEKGEFIPNIVFHGKPVSSRLETDLLQRLAIQGEGKYYAAQALSSWELAHQLVEQINGDSLYETEEASHRKVIAPQQDNILYDLYYQFPLGLALILLLLLRILPDTRQRITLYAFLLWIPMINVQAETQNVAQEEQLAQAFFAAQAYESSNKFYENILNTSPPTWQQAIVLYNLGTIQLAQNQWNKALALFRSIPIDSISTPLLLQHILMGQGLVYSLQSNLLPDAPDIQQYLLQTSLKYLEKAMQVSCQAQLLENPSLAHCLSPIHLSRAFLSTHFQLRHIQQKQRDALLTQGSFLDVFALLKKGIDRLDTFLQSHPSDILNDSYFSYAIDTSKTLLPLWADVQSKTENPSTLIQESYKSYLSAIQNIEKKEWNQSLKQIAEIQKNFHTLQEQLDEKETLLFQQQDLSTQNNVDDPQTILRHSLQEGKRALQLHSISYWKEDSSSSEQMNQIMINDQKKAVQIAASFIGSVFTQQQKRFRQLTNHLPYPRCQQSPWQQVIPLFEQGYQHALAAQEYLSDPSKSLYALSEQEQMVLAWNKALTLLEIPPEQPESLNEEMNQIPADTRDLFQSLQEMELNDTIRPPQSQKEILEW